jgi:hypothetical protein
MFNSFSGQDRCQLTLKEWKAAIGRVRPSAMRESTGSGEVTTLTFISRKNYFKINLILLLFSQFHRVNWDKVGGSEEARMYTSVAVLNGR